MSATGEKRYRLTEEQRVMVEENHNLIYSFAKKKGLDLSEYYDLLAIGLCKAGCTFEASVGCTFSTYAYRCMYNEYKIYLRISQCQKSIPENLIVSYDALLFPYNDDPSSVDLMDILEEEHTEHDITEVHVKEFIQTLTERQRFVLAWLYMGLKEREIAKALDISRSYVNRIKHQIGVLWTNYEYSNK